VRAGAIIVIAVAATGTLMMRFRKRWLAKIDIAVTNRTTSLFAGWMPGFGTPTHVGRKSGKVYKTPVNVFRAPNGFIMSNESLYLKRSQLFGTNGFFLPGEPVTVGVKSGARDGMDQQDFG
jgi:hypothetical protein